MKKILPILFSLMVLSACDQNKEEENIEKLIEGKNLSKIKNKKTELNEEILTLEKKVKRLNSALKKMDSVQDYPLISVKKLKDTIFKNYVEVQGSVETDENIVLYPEFTGILSKVYVEEGDEVKKGQLLVKVEDNGLSSQLAEAETKLNLAKTTYERQKRLWNKDIGSEMQYLEAKANYEGLQKSVQQLQTRLSKTKVRAPFAGTVDNIITEQGELVNQGQTQLMRLVSLKEMYVSADIPENYLSNINKGAEVQVEIPTLNRIFEGTVRQVSNLINPNNRTFQVKVSVPNKDGKIKPNLLAKIKVNNFKSENAIVISENFLREDANGKPYAFIVEETLNSKATVKKQALEIGERYENRVLVTKGLKTGDLIVTDGVRTIREGRKVKIRRENE